MSKRNPKPSRPFDWNGGLPSESESEKALFKLAWMSVGITCASATLALTMVVVRLVF